MRIGGFQKLTLLDYPGQMACIVFTEGCNLRCPFCHNAPLTVPSAGAPAVSQEEVLSYLARRRGLLDGVVLSGGEPLLQTDAADFLRAVRDLGYLIKLDTNGCYPQQLEALLTAGLVDHIAMDVKHRLEAYPLAVGRESGDVVAAVEASMALLRGCGLPFEFRTTFVKGIHQESDAGAIAAWIAGEQPYYLQSYVDSGAVLRPEGLSAFSPQELSHMREQARVHCPNTFLRGE